MNTPDRTTVNHDVLVENEPPIGRFKATKHTGDGAEFPHIACCAGCRALFECHGCGTPVSAAGHPGTAMRCTSGACPTCCARWHKHPIG